MSYCISMTNIPVDVLVLHINIMTTAVPSSVVQPSGKNSACWNVNWQVLKLFFAGKRRYDRKQSGYGGQTKPIFHKKVKFESSLLHKTIDS